jgi:protein-S-isoprenylcysteine O-methyltransferase Ste14
VPALSQVAIWSFAAFWIVWLVWGAISTRRRRVVARGGWGSGLTRWLLVVVGVLLLGRRGDLFILSHFRHAALWPGHPQVYAAGFLIEVAGIGVAVCARWHLGTFWGATAVVREGHRVVDTGPYHLVRHPIYSGILLAMAGLGFMSGAVFWLVLLLGTVIGFAWKIRAEERLLTKELGDDYTHYRQRTSMLIPWIW